MQRFIGLNTEDRLAMLRRAWLVAPEGANTLLQQLQTFAQQASESEDEDLQSSSSNSHSAMTQQPAMATAAAAEKTRAWYQIIDGFQVTRQFLKNCAKYGLDAFGIQAKGQFPEPLPDEAANKVVIDTYGKWAQLCDKYEDQWVNAGNVIGAEVSDGAIYLWLLDNPQLMAVAKGATEMRHDFTEAITGRAGGRYYA